MIINDMVVFDKNNNAMLIDSEYAKIPNNNIRILAYLIKTGALKKHASFYTEHKNSYGENCVLFVVDGNKLAEYADEIKANVEDIEDNTYFRLDKFTPGRYDGCVSLTLSMRTYRGVDECVSSSWETGAVRYLDYNQCWSINDIFEKQGAEKAGQKAIELFLSMVD